MRSLIKLALAVFILSLFAATQARAAETQKPKEWTFETEALILHRNQNIRKGLGTAEGHRPGTGPATNVNSTVIGAKDLKFGFRPGARFTLGYHPDPMNTFEVVYFGLQQWSASKKTDCARLRAFRESNEGFTDCLNAFFVRPEAEQTYPDPFNEILPEFNGVDAMRIKYESRLHNVELNYKRHFTPWGNFVPTLLAGFRFISVPERFKLAVNDLTWSDFGAYKIHTTNYLFGVQIGGDGAYRFGPSFELGLRAKVGLFANAAKQTSKVCESTESCGSDKKSGAAPAGVGEAGLFGTWNMHPNVALTAGYQVLYVIGLALAPDQMASSSNPGALSSLDTRGSIFYHGPSVGVKVGL